MKGNTPARTNKTVPNHVWICFGCNERTTFHLQLCVFGLEHHASLDSHFKLNPPLCFQRVAIQISDEVLGNLKRQRDINCIRVCNTCLQNNLPTAFYWHMITSGKRVHAFLRPFRSSPKIFQVLAGSALARYQSKCVHLHKKRYQSKCAHLHKKRYQGKCAHLHKKDKSTRHTIHTPFASKLPNQMHPNCAALAQCSQITKNPNQILAGGKKK